MLGEGGESHHESINPPSPQCWSGRGGHRWSSGIRVSLGILFIDSRRNKCHLRKLGDPRLARKTA